MIDQPNRFIWFFRLEGGGNKCAEYPTESETEAASCLFEEYGEVAVGAVRRELTCAEYTGLLRCNFDGHGVKVFAAIQDVFYRNDPRGATTPENSLFQLPAEDWQMQPGEKAGDHYQ